MYNNVIIDLLSPQSTPIKKNRLVEERDSASPDGGHTNPGFNDSDIPADISLAEEGKYKLTLLRKLLFCRKGNVTFVTVLKVS